MGLVDYIFRHPAEEAVKVSQLDNTFVLAQAKVINRFIAPAAKIQGKTGLSANDVLYKTTFEQEMGNRKNAQQTNLSTCTKNVIWSEIVLQITAVENIVATAN